VLFGLASAAGANADVGLPMIALVSPALWAAFIPVAIVEGAVLNSRLNLSLWRGMKIAFGANVASTAIGVPMTWIFLVALEMIFDRLGGVNTLWEKVLLCAVHAPWLFGPDSEMYWMVPAATLILLPAFFFASWWIEYRIIRRVLAEERQAMA
jgi:hypothetical protein